jgi:hypothetical protein
MKRSMLIPLAILGIAGGLAYMVSRRAKQQAAGEGAAEATDPASGLDRLFDSIFGPGSIAATPAPAPSPAPPAPAPSTPVDNGA